MDREDHERGKGREEGGKEHGMKAMVLEKQGEPLLCAGLIGHRSLRMTEYAARLGLYGFGAAVRTMD